MTLQDQIREHETAIAKLKVQQARCHHTWASIEYDPRLEGGYTTTAWHWPGSMRDGPRIYIPEERHPRWSRTCTICGLVQKTEHTKEILRPGTMPGTTISEKVPNFGDK